MPAFLDIDTQIDFVFPAGALYVPGAELIVAAIARLNRHAVANGFPLLSTACAHSENDAEFRAWRPHCVVGTVGQQKPGSLLLGQPIFEKQQTNLFDQAGAEARIAALGERSVVVYGVVTEVCVEQAALGLLDRGYQVSVVHDAVRELDPMSAARFRRELLSRGGSLVSVEDVVGTRA